MRFYFCFFVYSWIFCLSGCATAGIQWSPVSEDYLVAYGKASEMETAKAKAISSLSEQILVKVDSKYFSTSETESQEGDTQKFQRKKHTQEIIHLLSNQEIPGVKMEIQQTPGEFHIRSLLNKAIYLQWAREKMVKFRQEAESHQKAFEEAKKKRDFYNYLQEANLAYRKSEDSYNTYLTLIGLGGSADFDREFSKKIFQQFSIIRSNLTVVLALRETWDRKPAPEPVLKGEVTRLLSKMGIPAETMYTLREGAIPIYISGWLDASFSSQHFSVFYYRTEDNIRISLGDKLLYSSAGSGIAEKGGGINIQEAAWEAVQERAKKLILPIEQELQKILSSLPK